MAKKWGILTHLSFNIAGDLKRQKELIFDEEVWNRIVDKCEECGLNTIVLDVNDGVQWESHPEISLPGAWSKEKVRNEVLRLREKGIEIIPKLNFSTTHDVWMGEYGRMVSTSIYYKVCRDLILEVYDMFLQPEYIHIGMDEENWKHFNDPGYEFIAARRDGLLVHDINFFNACVKEAGAKTHMWHDPFNDLEPEFSKDIDEDIFPYVWMYYSYLKENWTLISEQDEEVREWYRVQFVKRYGYTVEYVEESPSVIKAMALVEKFMKEGHKFILTTSNLYIKNCEKDAIEFVRRHNPDFSCLAGMITTTWSNVCEEREPIIMESIELLGEAIRNVK